MTAASDLSRTRPASPGSRSASTRPPRRQASAGRPTTPSEPGRPRPVMTSRPGLIGGEQLDAFAGGDGA
jgi:hypothetical protein